MSKLNDFVIKVIFSFTIAAFVSSLIINFEITRLSTNKLALTIKNNETVVNQVDEYFSNITKLLDEIEGKYTGECNESIITFMRRGLFSILGGVEFGVISRFDKKSYVICNSWGDGENIKVRNPINFNGYLMTGPHKINSLGEPVYVVKKTKNDIEYNLILKISSLSGIFGDSNVSLIKSDKLLYGSDEYKESRDSNVIENIKYGFVGDDKVSLPLYYEFIIFAFLFIIAYFLFAKRLVFNIGRYILLRKLNSGHFFNVYQPIVDSSTGLIFSYEVFTRAVGHSDAIGLMNEIKRFNIYDEHAINQIKQVKRLRRNNVIQINLSVKNVLSDKFFSYISSLDSNFIKHIILEITEDDNLLENKIKVSERMKLLRVLGYRFAIDDYGAGYSNLAYLVELNFDYIKIDKSIIRNDNLNLLNIIRDLVTDLGATCIAEGVETDKQATLLNSIGITIHQGWYYGKPKEKTALN